MTKQGWFNEKEYVKDVCKQIFEIAAIRDEIEADWRELWLPEFPMQS